MAQPLIAGMAPDLTLSAGYVVRLNALDPLTGSQVSGVRVSDVSFFVRGVVGAATTEPPLPLLVPSDEP